MSESVRILEGDCRATLKTLPDESVHCCVTSPPYFNLRAYLPDGHPDRHLEIGREETLDEYLDTMVGVFEEVRRVLRKDGCCWLNIGDSYAREGGTQGGGNRAKGSPLKVKDLCMVPHRFAIRLQDAGWWVRQDCVWEKTQPMPESVVDRPSRSHEYVFLLSRSATYFYDIDATREPSANARRVKDTPGTRGTRSLA